MKYTNYIVFKNIELKKVENSIQELANIYEKNECVHEMVLYQTDKNENIFILKFNKEPDFETFVYFVNYLDVSATLPNSASVKGYWSVRENDVPDPNIHNKRIMLSNSHLVDVDCVFGVANDNMCIKFGYATGDKPKILDIGNKSFDEMEFKVNNFIFIKEISPIDLSEYYSHNGKKGIIDFFYVSNIEKFFSVYFGALILYSVSLAFFIFIILILFFNDDDLIKKFPAVLLLILGSIGFYFGARYTYKNDKHQFDDLGF